LGGHVRKDEAGQLVLLVDEEKMAQASIMSKELNFVGPDVLKVLRSKKVS
jgi:tRNA-dihydrouridine synthase 3